MNGHTQEGIDAYGPTEEESQQAAWAHQQDLEQQEREERIEQAFQTYRRALHDYLLKHGGYEQWSKDVEDNGHIAH